MNTKPEALLSEKTELLRSYAGVTVRLCKEPFEDMDSLFDIRAGLIKDYNEIEAALAQIPESDMDAGVLAKAKFEQGVIISAIKRDEKTISARLDGFKEELAAEYVQLQKSKQVIDYMDSTSTNVGFKGNTLDGKT